MSEAPLNEDEISSPTTQNINQEIHLEVSSVEIGIQQSTNIVCIILSMIYFPLMGIKSTYNFYVFISCLTFNVLFYINSIKKIVVSKNKENTKFIIQIVKTCICKTKFEYNKEDIYFGLNENAGYPLIYLMKNYANKKDIDFSNIMKKPPIRLIEAFGYFSADIFASTVQFLLNQLNDNKEIAANITIECNNFFINSENYYSFFLNDQMSNNDINTFLYLTNFFIHFVVSILFCFFNYLINIIVGCCLLIIIGIFYYFWINSVYRIDFFFSEEKDILIIGYVKMNQKRYDMINYFLLSDFEKFAVVKDKGNTIKMVRTNGELIEVINIGDNNSFVLEEFVTILNKALEKKNA